MFNSFEKINNNNNNNNISAKVIEKLSKYKYLEIETTRTWRMRTEKVLLIVVALGLNY